MNLMKTLLFTIILGLSGISFAHAQNTSTYPQSDRWQQQRLKTINEYLTSLKEADFDRIKGLFSSDAVVISTSHGRMRPEELFRNFFAEIKAAEVATFNVFKGVSNQNHYAAVFHFTWLDKNGTYGGGDFMDDFTFADNSDKLVQVFMFENKMAGTQ